MAAIPATRSRRSPGLRRWAIGTAVSVLVVLGAAVGYDQLFSAGTKPAALLPAPPRFSLARLGGSGQIAFPSAAYAHRPVVLVFFASWCPACQRDLPMVAGFARTLAAKNSPVRFLGVDGNDTPSAGIAFARRSKVPFAAVEDRQESVAYELGLPGLPDTVFIDRQGKVVHVVEGAIKMSVLRHWAGVLARPA